MNIDTDTQWAFTHPIKQFMDEKGAYLMSQIGNPEGPDKPNKKYIDPRGWLHSAKRGSPVAWSRPSRSSARSASSSSDTATHDATPTTRAQRAGDRVSA